MIDKLRESTSWQLFLVIALIILMPLAVDINERLSNMRRMRAEEAQSNQLLTDAKTEQQTLQDELDFVASDEYLEQWARVEAKMVKPDQVGVIPLWTKQAPEQTTPTVQENIVNPAVAPETIPDRWHRLFFDEPSAP